MLTFRVGRVQELKKKQARHEHVAHGNGGRGHHGQQGHHDRHRAGGHGSGAAEVPEQQHEAVGSPIATGAARLEHEGEALLKAWKAHKKNRSTTAGEDGA